MLGRIYRLDGVEIPRTRKRKDLIFNLAARDEPFSFRGPLQAKIAGNSLYSTSRIAVAVTLVQKMYASRRTVSNVTGIQ